MELLPEITVKQPLFIAALVILNICISLMLVYKMQLHFNRYRIEAAGGRLTDNHGGIYRRGREIVAGYFREVTRKTFFKRIYEKAEKKVRRAGYQNRNLVLWYLVLKLSLPALIFIVGFVMNYPDVFRPSVSALLITVCLESILRSNRVKLEKQFNKNAYKIYKYLYNQVSSGINPAEAFKTVYEAADSKELRNALVLAAAKYELTKDIDGALDELISRFDMHDTYTLCTAIRLGIITGDNGEILARQEEIMFKKHFNYIQAETERCRFKSVISAMFFTAVIIILISVPLIMDAMESINKIFSG